jgi:hypothetical protein
MSSAEVVWSSLVLHAGSHGAASLLACCVSPWSARYQVFIGWRIARILLPRYGCCRAKCPADTGNPKVLIFAVPV